MTSEVNPKIVRLPLKASLVVSLALTRADTAVEKGKCVVLVATTVVPFSFGYSEASSSRVEIEVTAGDLVELIISLLAVMSVRLMIMSAS